VLDTIVLWLVFLSVYSWMSTWVGFLVVASAKRIRNAGVRIPMEGKIAVYIALLLGGPGDFLYNTIIGTVRFMEFPKWRRGEWLYSARVERHANHPDNDERTVEGLKWALILNAADPGHIDL